MMDTKTCAVCGTEKPLFDFPPQPMMESGRDVRCYACAKESREKFERKWRDKSKQMRGRGRR